MKLTHTSRIFWVFCWVMYRLFITRYNEKYKRRDITSYQGIVSRLSAGPEIIPGYFLLAYIHMSPLLVLHWQYTHYTVYLLLWHFNSNCGRVTIRSPQYFWCDCMFTPNINRNMRFKGKLLSSLVADSEYTPVKTFIRCLQIFLVDLFWVPQQASCTINSKKWFVQTVKTLPPHYCTQC